MWQYYLLPYEEQMASGTKNPMCNTFPRIGDHVDLDVDELLQKVEKLGKRNSATTTKWLYNLPLEGRRQKFAKNISIVPASCNYWRWGSGGRQENINAICILALNHINDKVSSRLHHHRISFHRSELSQVFLVLWWWFIFITLVAFLRIFYRVVQWK